MSLTIEDIATYLGQTVQDIYGRKVGVIVGVYSEVDGAVNAVEVMISDSNYETIPASRLELKDDGLKILPEWLVEAKNVERKLDILRKRIKALEELYKKGQIPQHAYKELREKFDRELTKVKSDAKSVKENIRKRQYELENFIIHLEKAITHLTIGYTSGELPENGFKVSADFIRYAKQAALEEKKDLDKHNGMISKLEEELASVIKSFEEATKEVTEIVTQTGPIAVKVTG